jgi:metal-dependent amidase/aminoacylase/carboxypeptidase family protein
MPVIESIAGYADDLVAIRRDLHAHPEIGFEEHRTSARIAELLAGWGVEVTRGVGGTGVVGVLEGKRAGRSIGLRADMDALPMDELTNLPYRSTSPGVFHGCGHDGHVTMLLGAARYLAERRDFAGRVVFIFQPAEEGLGAALVGELQRVVSRNVDATHPAVVSVTAFHAGSAYNVIPGQAELRGTFRYFDRPDGD